ncbi:putative lipoprotein YjhA [Bacillus subtilis]|nr:putative lipoprotein YjhA [Bacillus subtilis]
MKKVLLLLFVLTIGLALSACSQSSDASEKEKPKEKKSQEELEKELDKELKKGGEPKTKKDDQIHKIGETIKVNDINFTVNKVDREQKGQYGDLGGKDYDKTKTVKDNEERLIIEVTLEYVGKGSMEYNRLGLDLKDKKNKSVRSVISLEDKGKMFLGGESGVRKKGDRSS